MTKIVWNGCDNYVEADQAAQRGYNFNGKTLFHGSQEFTAFDAIEIDPADLLAWRQDLGLTQRGAATALGVSLPTYQQLERGTAWATGKPVEIDKRTALACAAIKAGIVGDCCRLGF